MNKKIAIDQIVDEINNGLKKGLPWLDMTFGRAYKLTRQNELGRYTFPAVYNSGNDYYDVSPSEDYGNFSFVWIDDPQQITWQYPSVMSEVPFALIFWFDTRTITERRNVEEVKAQIFAAMQPITVSNGGFVVSTCYEQAANIYREFSLDETRNQFLTHPFAGLRIEGTLYVSEPCRVGG